MLRAHVVWTGLAGAPYFSTFHGDPGDNQTGADLFASEIATFLGDIEPGISNNLAWEIQPEVQQVDIPTGNTTATWIVSEIPGAGTNTATTLPRFTQVLVRLQTGVYIGGRQLRGRLFIPGPCTDNEDDDGTPGSALLTLIGDAAQALADGGSDWGVYSRVNGTFAPALTASCWSEWAMLRSRRD